MRFGLVKKFVLATIPLALILAACGGSSQSRTTKASSAPDIQVVTDELNGGLYRFGPFGHKRPVTVAATGPDHWVGYPDWAMDGPEPVRADAPRGVGVALFTADGVFSDPCHWDWNNTGQADIGDVKVGPSVDDLVAALRANTYYTSTAAKPVTIDGFSGQELELQMPGGSYAHCDKDDPNDSGGHVFPFSGPALYTQGPANRWHLYILDVNGTRLIAVILSYAKTPQNDVNLAQNIIRTMRIKQEGA
jgi:hypothetical protein